jgi:ATP-binding cassette, subfamily F, member 3
MRILSGEEAPDRGERHVGHQVITEYFAQDEATRLDQTLTVYEALATGSPLHMVPAIRNILGGFLFSGDDIHKKCGVLSGGERTRLAVARMLLRPSNLLLLDEPTNHLDLDSKDVLLDALIAYGGTLVFVSHDRYFVERLATRIIEIGHGRAESFPGTYLEFLWRKEHIEGGRTTNDEQRATNDERRTKHDERRTPPVAAHGSTQRRPNDGGRGTPTPSNREARKQQEAEQRKRAREVKARQTRLTDLEGRIAATEAAIKDLEAKMSAPGFYEDRTASQRVIDRHQALMWEVGELMHQWEVLADGAESAKRDDASPTSSS